MGVGADGVGWGLSDAGNAEEHRHCLQIELLLSFARSSQPCATQVISHCSEFIEL